jgi:hypothetical protein
MSESISERIAAALQARLAGIVGDGGVTYWYTPDRVLRVPAFYGDCLTNTLSTIYSVSPDQEEDTYLSFSAVNTVVKLDLAAARAHRPHTEQPLSANTPIRWTVQNRLVQDLRKCLRGDKTLGGLAYDLRIPFVELSAEETYLEGWATVFLRLEVAYAHEDAQP